jgi:hypothetical protein
MQAGKDPCKYPRKIFLHVVSPPTFIFYLLFPSPPLSPFFISFLPMFYIAPLLFLVFMYILMLFIIYIARKFSLRRESRAGHDRKKSISFTSHSSQSSSSSSISLLISIYYFIYLSILFSNVVWLCNLAFGFCNLVFVIWFSFLTRYTYSRLETGVPNSEDPVCSTHFFSR